MGVRFTVRLTPKGGRNEISGWATAPGGGTVLKARVTAPPEDGKANQALVRLLANALHIAGGRVSIVSGAASRMKLVEIADLAALPPGFGEKEN